eukprot:COSAG01_NODE_2398_length_7765_cov_29.002087_2_plen_82_part_00
MHRMPALLDSDECMSAWRQDTDPGEYTSVAASNPGPLKIISARLAKLQPTFFNPQRTGGNSSRASTAAAARGGYWGPFVFP